MAMTETITATILRNLAVGRFEERKPRFDYLAPELRVMILCQAEDLNTLKSLALSCKAYGKLYLTSRREVLLALVHHKYRADGLPLQLAFQTLKARSIQAFSHDRLDQIQEICEHLTDERPPRSQLWTAITAEQCLQLLKLHQNASRICDDVPAHTIARNPISGNIQLDRRALSTIERFRILRSILRWELWSQLFGSRRIRPVNRQSEETTIDCQDQMYNFLVRYAPWEQEELGCICDYATRRYAVLCNEAGDYFKETFPVSVDDEDDDNNFHWLFSREHRLDPILSALVSRGPQLLARILETSDPQQKCDTLMSFYGCPQSPTLYDLFEAASEEVLYPFPVSYSVTDAPYGWQWAHDGDDDYDIEVYGGLRKLWHWGFVYWDRERLEEWGIQRGGNVIYDTRKIEMRYQDTGIKIKRKPMIYVDCFWDGIFSGPGWT